MGEDIHANGWPPHCWHFFSKAEIMRTENRGLCLPPAPAGAQWHTNKYWPFGMALGRESKAESIAESIHGTTCIIAIGYTYHHVSHQPAHITLRECHCGKDSVPSRVVHNHTRAQQKTHPRHKQNRWGSWWFLLRIQNLWRSSLIPQIWIPLYRPWNIFSQSKILLKLALDAACTNKRRLRHPWLLGITGHAVKRKLMLWELSLHAEAWVPALVVICIELKHLQ